MKKPVIAIDGYSSTGKSSISKVIAEKLGLIHMDTGALYRGVTHFAVTECLNENGEINLDQLFNILIEINLEFRNIDNELVLFLNGANISKEIRGNLVSSNVSLIASQKEVRDYFDEAGSDISGMSDDELMDQSEVFAIADGRFLVVEG